MIPTYKKSTPESKRARPYRQCGSSKHFGIVNVSMLPTHTANTHYTTTEEANADLAYLDLFYDAILHVMFLVHILVDCCNINPL